MGWSKFYLGNSFENEGDMVSNYVGISEWVRYLAGVITPSQKNPESNLVEGILYFV